MTLLRIRNCSGLLRCVLMSEQYPAFRISITIIRSGTARPRTEHHIPDELNLQLLSGFYCEVTFCYLDQFQA